jgi:hypothetical protein
MRYRVITSALFVTKPDGTVVRRDTLLYYDTTTDTFGIRIIGDSPLKGYAFDVLQAEFRRARDAGTPTGSLPPEV